jgi:hypothetical protein
MNLFSSAGMIIRMPSDAVLLGFTMWDEYDPRFTFNFENRLALVTSMQTVESSLYQLRTMFNDKWYINVFGDNPGMLSISGMFAGGGCNSNFSQEGQPDYSGFELISMYYRQHRISSRYESILVTIGGFMRPMIYDAFLAECQVSAVDPQLQVGQFSMKFVYPMPENIVEVPPEEPVDPPEDPDDPGEPLPPPSPGQEGFLPVDYPYAITNQVAFANSLLP